MFCDTLLSLQSTHPRGCDDINSPEEQNSQSFNPHTREGVTQIVVDLPGVTGLQSTHPRGCDVVPAPAGLEHVDASIHTPARV